MTLRMRRDSGIGFLVLALSCLVVGRVEGQRDERLWKEAHRLHQEAIVVDARVDVLSHIVDEGVDLGERAIGGQVDIPRMREGGIDAEFFTIRLGAQVASDRDVMRRTLEMIDALYQQIERHPESLELATSATDIRRLAKQDKIAVLLGLEDGEAIEQSLGVLRTFYRLGIRYMALPGHHIAVSHDGDSPTSDDEGLSEFERRVILEMNRLGMLVDVSGLPDKTFFDVLATTKAPVIASHSSARALTDIPQNMSDDMLRAIASNGGIVMVNFSASSVDQNRVDAIRMRDRIFQPALDELRHRYAGDPEGFQRAREILFAAFELPRTPLAKLIDHIDHMVKVAGIDHVGLASGFDGREALPEGLKDCSDLPRITYELLRRGYRDADIKKILGENFLRVMAQVEDVARQMRRSELAQFGGRS